MEAFVEQCVERYLELAGKKPSDLRKAPTPTMDESSFSDDDLVQKGQLSAVAARIVMEGIVRGTSVSPRSPLCSQRVGQNCELLVCRFGQEIVPNDQLHAHHQVDEELFRGGRPTREGLEIGGVCGC